VQAIEEFVRVLRPGGVLILAVYLKTGLTPVHETVRQICLRTPRPLRPAIIKSIAGVVHVGETLGYTNNVRKDNPKITTQVEDWFFVPIKHFTTVNTMNQLFADHGLEFELLHGQTGRYRSSSNILVRGSLSQPDPVPAELAASA
jgi:hypothetical protein